MCIKTRFEDLHKSYSIKIKLSIEANREQKNNANIGGGEGGKTAVGGGLGGLGASSGLCGRHAHFSQVSIYYVAAIKPVEWGGANKQCQPTSDIHSPERSPTTWKCALERASLSPAESQSTGKQDGTGEKSPEKPLDLSIFLSFL